MPQTYTDPQKRRWTPPERTEADMAREQELRFAMSTVPLTLIKVYTKVGSIKEKPDGSEYCILQVSFQDAAGQWHRMNHTLRGSRMETIRPLVEQYCHEKYVPAIIGRIEVTKAGETTQNGKYSAEWVNIQDLTYLMDPTATFALFADDEPLALPPPDLDDPLALDDDSPF